MNSTAHRVSASVQALAEWASTMQACYAAAGHPYAWPPPQHLMAAAYGAPVPFPVYHPAYYAHASMAAVNAEAPSQRTGALSQMDERELKWERRKQSNRESARRSRLRKQQECEELAQKVTDLTAVNSALRSELDQLKKDCEDMETENSQLMDEMVQSEGPSVLTSFSIQIDSSKAHHGSNGQLHKPRNNDSKG